MGKRHYCLAFEMYLMYVFSTGDGTRREEHEYQGAGDEAVEDDQDIHDDVDAQGDEEGAGSEDEAEGEDILENMEE